MSKGLDLLELFSVFTSCGHGIKFMSPCDEIKSSALPPISRKDSCVDTAGYGRTIECAKAIIITREPKYTLDIIDWDSSLDSSYINLAFVGYTGKKGNEYFTHSSRVVSWQSIIDLPDVYYVTDLHGDKWYIYLHAICE